MKRRLILRLFCCRGVWIMRQKKLKIIISSFLIFCIANAFASQDVTVLLFDRIYPVTPISRVLRSMKQLYAAMHSIKEREMKKDNCTLARIVEIQFLSVCGVLQELDRAMENGFAVEDDHASLIDFLWKALQELANDKRIKRYLHKCSKN